MQLEPCLCIWIIIEMMFINEVLLQRSDIHTQIFFFFTKISDRNKDMIIYMGIVASLGPINMRSGLNPGSNIIGN